MACAVHFSSALVLAIAVLVAYCSCCITLAQPVTQGSPRPVYDAIIIGAGASGLAAAQKLQSAGLAVVVLEGRDRVGGRCWTENITLAANTANANTFLVDLGASWIHGLTDNPLVPLAESSNVALSAKTTNYENAGLYNEQGEEVSDALDEEYDATWSEFEDFLEAAQADTEGPDPGLHSVVDAFIAQEKLTGESLLAFNARLDNTYQQEYGAAISELSLNFDQDSGKEGGDKLVIDGYQNLIGSLAEGIDVILNTNVTEIAYSDAGVVVTTATGEVFEGKTAVVTLPIGVLKAGTVTFTPPLPASNTNAISAMGSGLLSKTILVFPSPFWGKSIEIVNFISPEGNNSGAGWGEWLSLYPSTTLPVLIGFNAAAYAAKLENETDTQIVSEAMTVLRMTWPTAPEPVEYKISRWNSDPFARGAYSFTTPQMGYEKVHSDVALALAGGRVQFAGEHTSTTYPATVNGAYVSGQKAACNILIYLGKEC